MAAICLSHRRLRVAGCVLSLWLLCPPSFAYATDPPSCWQPGQLTQRIGEHRIHKGVRQAYVPRPRGMARPQRRGKPVIRGAIRRVDLPAGMKRVALTFDLCEQPYEITGYQGDIVDYLRARDVPATFFAGGKWMMSHQDRTHQLMADPRFELANHAWEHRNFRLLDQNGLAREIDGAQLAYERSHDGLRRRGCRMPSARGLAHLAAPDRLSLFRFPFGACNPQALAAVNQRGLSVIQWDVSSADPWKGMTKVAMVAHVLRRTRSGSILIFHANGRGWRTGEALPEIIAGLKARGFSFVTVSDLLATPGAKIITSQTCYDEKPGDSDRYDSVSRKLELRYRQFHESLRVSEHPD